MRTLLIILSYTIALLSMSSCANETVADAIVSNGTLTIPDVPGQWTYVSLRQGKVMGTCALSDTTTQSQWATRTDWDIATCNGMIRTNGGTSGIGLGGAASTSEEYDRVDPTMPAQYANDRDTIAIW